jgi:hypothetical protein
MTAIAIQKNFGRLEAGPTVEPASSRREKTFLDKYRVARPGAPKKCPVEKYKSKLIKLSNKS